MPYRTSPRELLVAKLKEIKLERNRAECRTGAFWQDKHFIECDKVIKEYEDLIRKLI